MAEPNLQFLLGNVSNLSSLLGGIGGANGIDYDITIDEYYRMHNYNVNAEQHRRDLITYYLMGIGGMLVCCLGIIGNLLSLLVLTQKSMRLSTNSYLASLAVCDTIVLLLTIVLLSKDVDQPQEGQSQWNQDAGIYPHIFPYVHPLAFTFQVASIWLTLAFTVDRYIMICHPFRAEPFCTISRARKVIGFLFALAIVFNLPKFFEYETVMIPLPVDNATKLGYDLTQFGRSHVFREMYHSWFYIAFVCGIPFLSLAVLNAFLMHAVRLSRKRGKEINVADRKRNDTTVMLIGVVVVFFICQMPALVSRTIWAFEHDPQQFQKLPLYTLNEIGNFLIILNSAINIVPYYFFGRKFRREFWRLFCRCLLRYNKFQKLSRSFSLTIMDPQQTSRRSSQTQIQTNHNCTPTYGSHQNLGSCLSSTPLMGPKHFVEKDNRNQSVWCKDEPSVIDPLNPSRNEPINVTTTVSSAPNSGLRSEVNGNCLMNSPTVLGEGNGRTGTGNGTCSGNGSNSSTNNSPPRKCLVYINSATPPNSSEHVSYADEEL